MLQQANKQTSQAGVLSAQGHTSEITPSLLLWKMPRP